ncbi:MAG TPA: hypothetical protein VHR97_11115 [Candidatus Baltobacteraceae bacterium]|jgi:hypothetical protein|nr:hypothetical protein [Candidatus Baltobacteraceae bacterium]
MRLFTSAVCAAIAICLFAGCAGNMGPNSTAPLGLSPQVRNAPISVFDDVAPPRAVSIVHSLMLPDKKTKLPNKGTYVSEFNTTSLLGYAANNKKNGGPICTIDGVAFVNDLGVDGTGNLMVPNPGETTGGEALNIHQGPTMCGKLIGSISDPFGQPSDATSPNALTGQIALGNLVGNGSTAGSLSICTFKGGCTVNLTNSNYFHVGGVGMSNAGDCWIDVKTSASGGVELVYYKGCAGSGTIASGFKQTYYGGIDIDKSGNLVIIDDMAEDVYIYRGCDPTCTVVGGPFALKGESFWGKLNFANNQFTAAERTNGVVDVYSYSTKSIKFLYSYDSGLSASLLPNGVAVNPRSKQ